MRYANAVWLKSNLPPFPVMQATTIQANPKAQTEWLKLLYAAPAALDKSASYKPYTNDNKIANDTNQPTRTAS